MITDKTPGLPLAPGTGTRRSETRPVLVVDDDPNFRRIVHLTLEMLGYEVIAAGAAKAALEIAARNKNILLLITDVAMPVMNGAELARRICVDIPNVPVLFISGFPPEAAERMGVATDSMNFLQKPFQPAAIDARIRAILASDAVPAIGG